jgi:hypothetical protein
MAQLASSVKSISFIERTLILLNLVALLVRYFFHYEATLQCYWRCYISRLVFMP